MKKTMSLINLKVNSRILLVLLTTMPLMAEARNVDSLTARTMAVSVLTARGAKTALHDVTPAAWRGNLYLYAGEQRGFVLLPADDAVCPILAYSTTGAFPTDNIPPQVQALLQQYSDMVDYAREHNLPQHPEWRRPGGQTKDGGGVGPLLTTAWGQYYPYNTLCPEDPGYSPARSLTGCVATATAQIMRYWQWPEQGWGQHEYVSYTHNMEYVGLLSERFDTVHYQWDLMPDVLDTLSSDAEIYAVSRLMYDCGVAVDMSYSFQASGADIWSTWDASSPSAGQALRTYFRYHPTLRGVSRSDYSDSAWMDLVTAEFDAGRPILYSATLTPGAHAFLADGYDADRRIHFNFGWNGIGDGFYALDSSICPTADIAVLGDHRAVVGIRPNTEECDTAAIHVVANDSLAGYCTGSGRYAYADSVSVMAHAAEGYRFDGWTSGSYENPHCLPATISLYDTARFRRLAIDTLGYATPVSSLTWSNSVTSAIVRWGIRIPVGCLHGDRVVSAVQYYKKNPQTSEVVRLNIHSGSRPGEAAPVWEKSYTVAEGVQGWVSPAIDTLLAVDTTGDLWVTFVDNNPGYNWWQGSRSTYSGNSDGCWFYNQDGWNTLDSIGIWATWMLRVLTGPAPDSVGIVELANDSPFTVYPNPFRQSVRIKVERGRLMERNGTVAAILTDPTGRREEVCLTPDGSGRYTLDLTSRPQGAYFLILTTADGRQYTVRLLKQSD